jgi:hypothetical protein
MEESKKGTWCADNQKGIIKSFPSGTTTDVTKEQAALTACNTFCVATVACKFCSVVSQPYVAHSPATVHCRLQVLFGRRPHVGMFTVYYPHVFLVTRLMLACCRLLPNCHWLVERLISTCCLFDPTCLTPAFHGFHLTFHGFHLTFHGFHLHFMGFVAAN